MQPPKKSLLVRHGRVLANLTKEGAQPTPPFSSSLLACLPACLHACLLACLPAALSSPLPHPRDPFTVLRQCPWASPKPKRTANCLCSSSCSSPQNPTYESPASSSPSSSSPSDQHPPPPPTGQHKAGTEELRP